MQVLLTFNPSKNIKTMEFKACLSFLRYKTIKIIITLQQRIYMILWNNLTREESKSKIKLSFRRIKITILQNKVYRVSQTQRQTIMKSDKIIKICNYKKANTVIWLEPLIRNKIESTLIQSKVLLVKIIMMTYLCIWTMTWNRKKLLRDNTLMLLVESAGKTKNILQINSILILKMIVIKFDYLKTIYPIKISK